MEIPENLKLSKGMKKYAKTVYKQIIGKESSLNFSLTHAWPSPKINGVLVTTTTITNLSFKYLLYNNMREKPSNHTHKLHSCSFMALWYSIEQKCAICNRKNSTTPMCLVCCAIIMLLFKVAELAYQLKKS